jgi:integrase
MTTTLTDRFVQGLKARNTRYEVRDTLVPGLYVDVTKAGAKNFVLCTRYPNQRHPGRRTIGKVGVMSLANARATAREWLQLIAQGIDPHERNRQQCDMQFAVVIEEFLTRHVRQKRKHADVEREIRKELIPPWRNKAIDAITRDDVRTLIERIVDRGAKYQAHNIFSHARKFFNWCIGRGLIDHSPCDRLKPAALIGVKQPRQRVLTDDELRAVWAATDELPYPNGPFYKMLMLTGARKTEVSDAAWSEFDFDKSMWTIPAERFKSNAMHMVPLTPWAKQILRSLPRFTRGDYVFTTTSGIKPINGFSKSKSELDALASIPEWNIHDLRRTVRTRLSELRVRENVAEMVIGHARKGLARVYDQHQYRDEMREALEAWERKLRSIVRPATSKVVALRP